LTHFGNGELRKFIPEYLNFLKEFVDLDALPLKISREQLQ
jgi:HSP90 family molecular chaperone